MTAKNLPGNLPHPKVDWSHHLHKENLFSPKIMQQVLLVLSLPTLQLLPGSL